MTVASLYATHLPYVRGVVRKLGVAAPDVDDVTQEVFCVVLRRSAPAVEPQGARRWLYQVARRVLFGLVGGFTFGRLGCALVHDHPGVASPTRAPTGRLSGLVAVGYATVRFGLDFLRSTAAVDGGSPDPRYLGLTAAQYITLAFLAVGLWLLRRPRSTLP